MAVTNQNTNTEEENVITLSDSDLPTLNNNSKLINPVGDTSKLINPIDEPIRSYGDDPFSNFAEGFMIGGRGLIANFNYALSEFEDDPIKEFDMKKWADEVIANSPDSDGSAGQWIGQLVPSVLPVAGAVVTSMIPGGQPIAGTLGNIALATLSFSSAGAGLRQYDKDKISAGLDPSENQGERFAIATAYGASEAIFERLALNKFLPKSVTSKIKEPIGKLISQGNKIEPKVANRVVADFIKKKPSALKKYASVGNREGWTEAATSLSQDLADSYFLENKPTLTQIGANMIESYGAGVLMGAGVGKLSFLSQDLATKRRRESQGDVYLTVHEGVTKEIVGKSGKESSLKFDLLEADGNIKSVNENEISDIFSVSNKQFENILESKDYESIINDEIYTVKKNIELETERASFQELEKFADSKGAILDNNGKRSYNVITASDRNYLITGKDKDNPKIVYGFDIDAFSELGNTVPIIPINIDNADTNIKTWNEGQMNDLYQNIQKENAKLELGTPNPVKGQSIMYEGEKHNVMGTFEGVVNLKNTVTGDDVQIDKKTFDDIINIQNDLNPARKTKDQIPINDDGSIGEKQAESSEDLPSFNIGRAKYKVAKMDKKTSEMTIGKAFTIEETAIKTAENLSKNYGNLDFEVVNETDTSDLMAKNKFVIKAKPKGKKVDPFKAAKDKAKEIQAKEKVFSPAAEDVFKAIETNQGKEQADAFKKEYDRLVNKLIKERQKKDSKTPQKKSKKRFSKTLPKNIDKTETDSRKEFANKSIDEKNLNTLRKSIRAKSKGKNKDGDQIESMTIQILDDISRGETSGEFVDPVYFDELMSDLSYIEVADMLVQDKMFDTKVEALDYLNTLSDFGRSTPKRIIRKKPVKGTITKKGDIKMSKEFLDRLPFYDPIADSGMEYTRQIDPYIKGNVKRVEAVIKRLTGTWRKAPKVKVYQSFADFVPDNAVNNPLEYANTNAFYDPDTDQIVFFANQFLGLPNSVIEKKLYHEAVGHQGLKGLLSTKDFNSLMDGVYNDIMLKNKDRLSNNIAFTYIHTRYNPNLKFDPNINYLEANRPDGKPMSLAETREIAEEYIAHKIEDPKFSKSANNLAGSFKNAISSLTGKEFTISNNDIKRIINSATQYIEKDGSLFNKNIIKYSLSSKYNKPDEEVLNKIRESRNLKRGDDIDNGKYRPELDKTVNKLNQDDFEAIVKGKVIEPALYDVLTTGDTKLYNPIFGYDVDMKGLKGGPNNLFLKENIKHNIAVSYTKVDKALNMLKRINIKKVDYITYVLTGTGSNLTANIDFRKAMFGKGGFVSKIPFRDAQDIQAKDVIYSAVFFDTNEVTKKYNQIHPNLFSHHSTIEFKPRNIRNLSIGDNKSIKITGRLTTDKVDVLLVENELSKNEFPHITLSTAKGVKPVESNKAIKENQDKIVPINDVIKGNVGVLTTDNKEITDSGTFTMFRDDFINRAKGSTKDVNIDKEIEQLSKFKSLSKFSETIMGIPFNKFQVMANKVFPETVGTPKTNIMQTKYGLPTRDSIIGALADPMFANAQGGDIVSISKPDPTTLYINEAEYNALAKAEIKKYEDMGYKVLVTPKEAEHPSYPYAIGGEAIGILDQFQNYADIYTKLDKNKKRVAIKDRIDNPNFNIGRRSNTLIDKFNVYKKTNRGPSENPFVTQKVSVAPFRYFQDYMSDIVKDKEIKPSDVVGIMNKRDFSSYRKAIVDTGKLFNLKVGNLVNNVGVYANEVEYSNSIDVIGKKEDIQAYAVAMATIKEKQREVIVSEEVEQSNDVNMNITFKKNVDIDKIIEKAKDSGIDGLSFDVNQNKMTIFGIQLDGNQIGNKYYNFLESIFNEKKAVQYQKVQNEFIKEKDYARILKQYRSKGYNKTRSDLNQFISNLPVKQKPLDNIQETEIRQSRNLNYSEDYQNNLHSEMIMYLKKHPEDNLTARTWLNKLFGNTDLTVQDLKWMGIYNQMMDKNRILQKNNVIDIIANSKYKTIDLNKDSKEKNIVVTTDYNENVTNRDNINFLESFTRYPITAEIKAKFINNGEYDIVRINEIKGDEEVALKELIKKSNYEDIFAIAYENKQMLNKIKTKYDFRAIVDKIKLSGKEYGLLIISPKLKEQSRGDMGLRYSQNLPQGFDDNSFIINQESMRYYMQDKMIYLKRLQEYVESKGYKVEDDSNAYVKENLSKGKVQEKTERFHSTYFEPMMKHIGSITKKGRVDYQEISDYVYGLHAQERRKYVDPGITVEEQDRYIANGESKINARDRNKLINMIKEITKFNVTEAFNYGLITKQHFNKFMPRKGKSKTAMFDFYVPLRGFEKSEFDNTAFSYVNMKAKGRGGFKADDPLAYMYIMAQSTIIQGEKNNTKKALLNFVRQFPNPNLYEIKNMYFEMGDNKIQETDIKPTGDFKYALDPFQDAEAKAIRRFEGKEADMTVFEEGRKKVITFIGESGRRLVDGFKGYNVNRDGMLGKLYSGADAVSQVMRKTFTQYSPEFIPINFIRDITSGYINIRNDFGGKVANDILSDVGQSFKTLKQYYGSKSKTLPKGDEGTLLAQFIENGSKTGWSQLKTVDEIKQEIDDYAKSLETADKTSFTKIIKKPLRVMDTINTVLENTVRFAAFKKLIKMGKTLDEASIYAKDLTVNFNRKGYYGNVLNSLYLFYNAGIQGVERLARPLVNKKTRYQTATNYFLALPLIGLISQMLSRIITGEDEEQDKYYYDLLPEYTRTHNLILPNPLVLFKSEEELKKMNTRDRFITIPLPYGHNVFLASPDHMTRAILGVESPSEAFLNTFFTGVESFSPLGPISNEGRDDQGFRRYVAPTVLTPFVDLSQNRNFAGSPIYREDSPYAKTKTPASLRHFNSVNPAIKAVTDFFHNATGGTSVESGVIEINPEIPEFLLTSYFGGVASLGINTGTLAIHNAKEITGIETPKKDGDLVIGNYNVGPLRKLPFVRRFITEVSPFSASEDYYKYKEKIDDVVGKKKKYIKNLKDGSATREEYKDFIQDPENKEYLRLENVLKSYDKQIKNLREIKERHIADGNAVKEEQIQKKINQLYKKFNKFVNVKELRTLEDIMSFIQE